MQTKLVSDFPDALLSLIEAVKLCYHPPPEIATRRGRKPDFSALSFLLLAVVAVVTKTFSDSELHRLLERDAELRTALEFSRVPHRTRILRRLKSLREAAEEQVSLFGKVYTLPFYYDDAIFHLVFDANHRRVLFIGYKADKGEAIAKSFNNLDVLEAYQSPSVLKLTSLTDEK